MHKATKQPFSGISGYNLTKETYITHLVTPACLCGVYLLLHVLSLHRAIDTSGIVIIYVNHQKTICQMQAG